MGVVVSKVLPEEATACSTKAAPPPRAPSPRHMTCCRRQRTCDEQRDRDKAVYWQKPSKAGQTNEPTVCLAEKREGSMGRQFPHNPAL